MGNLHGKLCEKSRGKRSSVYCLSPPETFKNSFIVNQSDKEGHDGQIYGLIEIVFLRSSSGRKSTTLPSTFEYSHSWNTVVFIQYIVQCLHLPHCVRVPLMKFFYSWAIFAHWKDVKCCNIMPLRFTFEIV